MKHYFLVAKDVGDLTAIVCAALEERQAKPRAVLDRLLARLRRRPKTGLSAMISSSTTTGSTVATMISSRSDPVNLIRLFWLADRPACPSIRTPCAR